MESQLEKKNQSYVSDAQLLRINDVVRLTTLSKSCINLWVAHGKFPKPITLSPTIKVWRMQQVTDWIDENSVREAGCSKSLTNLKSILIG